MHNTLPTPRPAFWMLLHARTERRGCVQRSLGLGHNHATELLNEVAERVKTGPKRGEWVLKAVYRKTGEGDAAMEGAA